MGGVRPPPERIQDQNIESLQMLTRAFRYLLDIGDIGQVSEPVAEHPEMAVIECEREHIDTRDRDVLVWLHRMQAEAGLGGALIGPYRVIEDVIEGGPHPLQRLRRAINRERLLATHREDSEIIDAVDMIGVLVCVHHRIDPGEAASEQLQSELRRRIDQDRCPVHLQDCS
jgi:hypothetical protein